MYKVLLISFANWDSIMEIPALLKDGGCTVDVFCVPGSWALQNEAYSRWIEASADKAVFVNQLMDYFEKHASEYQWIIPGDDAIIRELNERINDEALFYKVMPLTKMENRELMGSKAGFSSLCTKYGIVTPRYMVYNPALTPKAIGGYMGYPLLMKVDHSESGFGIFLCYDEQALTDNLDKVTNKTNLVFQQFIKGYDVNVEVLYKNGELIVYSYSRTLTIMGKFGVSTQRLFYQNQEVEAELVKMGRSLGLSGFGNVVFMYSEAEQKHYLIEIDARPNAWMHYGKYMGNDFSEGVKKIIHGGLTLVRPGPQYAGKRLKISLYKKEVYRCILEKDFKTLAGWLVNKDDCWRYMPRYDRKTLAACNSYLYQNFRDFALNKIRRVLTGKKAAKT